MGDAAKAKRKMLRWRRQPRETGLAGCFQGERDWHLMYGDDRVGTVALSGKRGIGPRGYYFYAADGELGIPPLNMIAEVMPHYPDADAAKAACREYVAGCLENAK